MLNSEIIEFHMFKKTNLHLKLAFTRLRYDESNNTYKF